MPEGHETRWWWYDAPKTPPVDLSWENLLSHWDAIETDFHLTYGVDFADGTLTRRSWRWFTVRTVRLLAEPDTRLARVLKLYDQPRDQKPKGS